MTSNRQTESSTYAMDQQRHTDVPHCQMKYSVLLIFSSNSRKMYKNISKITDILAATDTISIY